MHETTLHERNAFITLTYEDRHLPRGGTLYYRHTELFLKRARKNIGPFRYFLCGEYGETTWRPHYHAILWGLDFDDKKHWSTTDLGHKTYTSEILDRTWGLGHCLTADVTFESIAYTTRYVTKKRTGKLAEFWYRRYTPEGKAYWLEPERAFMSLRPGIGKAWLDKYYADVYNHDYVITRGKKTRPPIYYDKLYALMDPGRLEEIKGQRELDAYELRADNTDERLRVKEQVQHAAIRTLRRNKQ